MKESDIRPRGLFEEYLRLSAEDVEQYFAKQVNRVQRSCPACSTDAPQSAFQKNGFDLVRCGECETLYVTPGPEASALAAFYTDSPSQKYWANVFFPSVAEARREMIFAPRAAKIATLLEHFGIEARRVADVGAGTGLMLAQLRNYLTDTEFLAVEPTQEMADECRRQGFAVYQGFADEAAQRVEFAGTVDLAMTFEVIEHVISPVDFLNSLANLVRPGGYILFTGLCGSGFDIQLLEEKSNAICPPHHLNFITRKGVKLLLDQCGLEEVMFATPGVLDVDIVRNALLKDKDAVSNMFLQSLMLNSDESVLNNLQSFLTDNHLSSHMWVVARKPLV